MNALINYLIESGISLGILTLIYFLLFRKETFFRINRFYLLLSVVFSSVLPFIQYSLVSAETPFVLLDGIQVNASGGFSNIIETVNVYGTGYTSMLGQFISSVSSVIWLLGIGVAISLILLIVKLFRLNGLFRKGNIKSNNGYVHIQLSGSVKPFSFFNIIFTGENFSKNEQQSNQIIKHELAHVNQLHSVDILIVELLTIIQWWNPFLWILKTVIRENHEYLADEAVLNAGFSKAGYKQLLLQQGLGLNPEIVNNLNVNMIKKRFKMMSKMKSHKVSILKYTAGLITCVALFVAFTGSSKAITGLSSLGNENDESHFVLVNNENDAEKQLLFNGSIYSSEEFSALNIDTYSARNVSDDEAEKIYPGLTMDGDKDIVMIEANDNSKKQKQDQVFSVVEKMPIFPGGEDGLKKYLLENIKYPADAKEAGLEEKVYVSFVVGKNGKVKDAVVAKGQEKLLMQEAMRVILSMPEWTPGEQKGKKVDVQYTVPINFSLGNDKKDDANNQVFVVVEEMPEYPGGHNALVEFISQNIKYPAPAKENGIQGTVYVSFVVAKDGTVKDAEVARSIDPILDEEALRVVNALPAWKPGKQRGKNVNVKYTVPIGFKLDGKESIKNGFKNIELSVVESDEVEIEKACHPGKPNDDGIYVIVEEMPTFPGGEEALRTHIANNVKYPLPAAQNGIQGKVYVTFTVDIDGSVIDPKIARGVDPMLDKEAIRVIGALPKWKPGKEKGKPVKVVYTVPINFKLDGNKSIKNQVFTIVETMPEYPGGIDAFQAYINKNVKYPPVAKKQGVQGKVYVSFVVDENGSVSDVKIARGADPLLDTEAIRVVSTSPKWKPGEQRGEKVKVAYTVPINFAIN